MTKELKQKIRNYLAANGEATAKKIAIAVEMKDYPSNVISALSEMRTDAEVECEKRKGKGNELWYWLTNATHEAAEMPTDKECCNAAKVVATTAGKEVFDLRNKLDDAKHVIANAREALSIGDGESIVLAIQKMTSDLALKSKALRDIEAKLEFTQDQLVSANALLMENEEAIDVKDAAKGYLVCAPKRKPMKLSKPESAVAKATAAAKVTGRCEVFALVPVGVAVRKQVKAVEFKRVNAA